MTPWSTRAGAKHARVAPCLALDPTGTSIHHEVLARTIDETRRRGGFAVIDEIYQRLCYDAPPTTALTSAMTFLS